MPIIKSAKKKLRQDTKKTKTNLKYEASYKKALDLIRKNKNNKEKLAKLKIEAYSAVDKAAKKKVIHKNKAARLKSRISKL